MDQLSAIQQILDRLNTPAFAASGNQIIYANQPAIQMQINADVDLSELIRTGKEEYDAFQGGQLCLELEICGVTCNASVVRESDLNIFYLETQYEESELRAFALAAQCLREPLTGALSQVNHLLGVVSPEVCQQMEGLTKNLHQLQRALCNMTDASGYELPRPSRTEFRNITGLMRELFDKVCHMSQSCDRKLIFNCPNEDIYTLVDAEKIERAVYNLLSNAIKNTPVGETIKAELYRGRNKLYLTIEDAGNINSYGIFANYLRAPGTENQQNGIGLGLTLVKKAAISHGGALLMDKNETGGTRFTISLAITQNSASGVRSHVMLPVDYAGEFDHALIELSDVLPSHMYHS